MHVCLFTLRWRHNGRDSVSNHQPQHCLLNRLFRRRSKKTSKLCVTDLCVGNSPGTGEFPAQMASNAENVSIWWRHHELQAIIYLNADVWCVSTHIIQHHAVLQPKEIIPNPDVFFPKHIPGVYLSHDRGHHVSTTDDLSVIAWYVIHDSVHVILIKEIPIYWLTTWV